MGTRKSAVAGSLAFAYALIIVYASLQPFSGWRMPSDEVLRFLGAPWPRYVTAGDILLNIVAYLPLGAILFASLRPALKAVTSILGATLLAAMLSLALESVQMFLPSRIASNLDLLTNISGAVIGALAAWMFTLSALAGNPLTALRNRAIRPGAIGDRGLLVVALWILIQSHQAPLTLGNGDFRDALGIKPLFAHAPWPYVLAETAVAAFAIVVLGEMISLLARLRQGMLPLLVTALLLAFAAKSLAAVALTRSVNWLTWLTPGVAIGTVTGVAMLAMLLRPPPAARAIIGLLCLAAGVLIVNVTPENPYQPVSMSLLAPQPSHLINFSNIVHAMSQLWPLIAAAFLFLAGRSRHEVAPL